MAKLQLCIISGQMESSHMECMTTRQMEMQRISARMLLETLLTGRYLFLEFIIFLILKLQDDKKYF